MISWDSLISFEIALSKNKQVISFIKRLFTKRKKILLLGCSGAGKSQFVNSLSDKVEIIQRTQRTLTTEKTKVNFEEISLMIIDTAGHKERKQLRKQEIKQILIEEKAKGLLNVVSYGFHEFDIDTLNKVKEPFTNKISESFLAQNRELEVEQLNEWVSLLELTNVEWVITLVTKADLWWDSHNEVREFYENGAYAEVLKKHNRVITNYVIPYCSVIEPYFGISTSSTFGQRYREGLSNNFLKTLLNLNGKIN